MFWQINDTEHASAIDLHVEEEKITLNGVPFELNLIKSRNDFRDFNRMVFPLKQISNEYVVEDVSGGKHFYPSAMKPFDLFSYTNVSKMQAHEVSQITNFLIAVSFVFYPHTTNFKDALLVFAKSIDVNVPLKITTTDSDGNKIDYLPEREFDKKVVHGGFSPKCTLQATSLVVDSLGTDIEFFYRDIAGEAVTCNFTATVKSDKGYISHSKIDVIDGKGKFKFFPMGLSSGEEVKVQVGIGKYTDIVNITLTVK